MGREWLVVDTQAIQVPGIVLERELGRGAYAVVFRARRGDSPCAVKLARRRGGSARWFRREAVALARVRDPGVPAVLEVGDAEGTPYLVMELVHGEPLSERLQRGPFSEPQVVQLALELTRTLRAIHRRGFLHRDLKPHNIVVEREAGRPRIIDFGLAVPLDRTEEDIAGTRAYAAPEQLGETEPVDARADLYGLGAVLFECATGSRPPAASDLGRRASLEQTLRDAGLDAGLRAVLAGALARSPQARYPSAGALLSDLERLAAGVEPRGPHAAEERPDPAGRLPLVGRARELERLRGLWAEARGGWGRALLVRASRGAGKSRLLEELQQDCEAASPLVLHARCDHHDPRPFPLLRDLLRHYVATLDRLQGDERAAGERRLREALAEHLAPLACTVSPDIARVLEQDDVEVRAADARDAFAEGLAEFLRRLVRATGPTLVVVDDLQWSDAASREVLVRLALRAPELPLLLVAAGRTDDRAHPSLQRFTEGVGTDRLETLELEPLSEHSVGGLVGAYLGGAPPEPALVSRVAGLAGGTPLAALQTVETMLDDGALVPFWGTWRFDRDRADRIPLPQGVLSLVERRLEQLPAASRRVLEEAAILGREVDLRVLSRVMSVALHDLRYAADDAQRAGLVEPARERGLRFVHDSVREALEAGLAPEHRRDIHERAARVLEQSGATDTLTVYEIASHYRDAGEAAPLRPLYETTRRAAERALAQFDDDNAMRFYEVARDAADRADIALEAGFHRGQGEAALRVGALDESLAAFRRALAVADGDLERAQLLGRIAWVHQVRSDTERAWDALGQAFGLLGEPAPTGSVGSFGRVAFDSVRARLPAIRRRSDPIQSEAIRTLCELHCQSARLASENGQVARTVQSTVRLRDEAERLGEDRLLARAHALYGALITTAGRQRSGARFQAAAWTRAKRLGEPAVLSYCQQLGSVAACWRGDFDEALEHASRCLVDYGAWVEATDYCLVAHNGYVVEAIRGRYDEAYRWLALAKERVRRQGHAPSAFSRVLAHCFEVVRAAQAEETPPEPLPQEPADIVRTEGGFFGTLAWGARVRRYTERGDYGPGLERLVAEFESEGHNPRRAHLALAEYYVAIAHARVHQCIRASAGELELRRQQLDAALRDLRPFGRIPMLRAHLRVVEAYREHFARRPKRARAKLDEARTLADRESAPWVSFEVVRCEAHMLRAEGRAETAREKARIAAMLAREHRAMHRVRWVCDELDVPMTTMALRSSFTAGPRRTSSTSRRRRQLRTLLQVVRASTRDLHADEQARLTLDELLESMEADRGLLLFESEPGRDVRVVTGRTAHGEDLDVDPTCRAVVDRVRSTGEPWSAEAGDGSRGDLPVEDRHVAAVPLSLQERVVGVVYVDRDAGRPPFAPEEEDVLMALAQQVPVALELARTLREREQLEANLRQSQKLETVGQLAGGVAHDFNNMLTAIKGAVDDLSKQSTLPDDEREHLALIQQASERAAGLTRQLLTFSRRQVVEPDVYHPNTLLSELVNMLRPILGDHVGIDLQLASEVGHVKVDRSSFEQAVVNLAVNARDAMPRGGKLVIETKDVELDRAWVDRHGSGIPGPYVRVRVTDTGEGMSPEVLSSIFEPFFTTKPVGRSSGLGLSTVYGFVKQASGLIDVSSEPGRGTTFLLYFPRSAEAVEQQQPASDAPPPQQETRGGETVLVVEDEELVRTTLLRLLKHGGYRVHAAASGDEALELAREHASEISLVLSDVLMPDMNGPDLAERLGEIIPDVKVLYVSGYTDGELVSQGVLEPGVELLQKPFHNVELCDRVREVLDS